jgi:hypothetical protein
VETNYFVLPNNAIGGAAETPRAADFRATVGKDEYEVRSVTRASDWKDLKTVVVFDLAATAPESRACLIQQAKKVAPRLLKEKNIQFYVVSSEWTEFHNKFLSGSGPIYEYFLPEPGNTADPCSPSPARKGQFESGLEWAGNFYSGHAFEGVINTLKTERGPVRIFWVGQGFLWFYTGAVTPMKGEELEDFEYSTGDFQNQGYEWIGEITRAGINLSPISWFNGEKQRAKIVGNQKNAAKIAQFLGGQAIACSQDLGPCLENALATSAQGWVVQVAGPPTERTDRYRLDAIELCYKPDRAALDVKRPFLLGAGMPLKSPIYLGRTSSPPVTPLFDTEWLMGKAGCSTGPASRAAMTALIPATAMGDAGEGPQFMVEFFNADAVRAKADELMHMKVRRAESQPIANPNIPGKFEVCVDLPSPTSAKGSYRVVVFNPKTGWAGVGVLPTADVVEYLRQH